MSVFHGIVDFTAGSLGGIALVIVGQPFDTIKVKMQTFPKLYNGMVDCFRKTLTKDGFFRGLYAGTGPALTANIAENSVLFASYGACQVLIAKLTSKQSVTDLSTFNNASAGCLAAFFSTFALTPTELIKCKMQAMREYKNTSLKEITSASLVKDILKKQGVGGLFVGFIPTLAREMPGYFFFFGSYELTRELLKQPGQHKDDIGWIKTMAAGSVGGLVLWTVIFPADVIKSRIQVTNSKENMFQMGYQIARQEGFTALYNGLKPTLIRTIPATAVLFLTYEYSKKIMTKMLGIETYAPVSEH